MVQLDGVNENQNIVTIATTNRIEVVESAIRNRPGRFDRVIEFSAMDESCRKQFIEKLLSKTNTSDANQNYLLKETDGFTGAQVEELINTIYIMLLNNDTGEEFSGVSVEELIVDSETIDAALKETSFAPKKWGFGRTN